MRPLLPLTLVAMLLVAGCAGPLQTDGGVGAAETETGPSISVSGTGTASADADLAVVRVSITALEADAETARNRVAEDSQAMFDALTDVGVDTDEAVTTAGFRISPEYNYREDGRELLGYRAVHSYQIEVAPDEAGSVVDAAVGAVSTSGEGGIVVDGIQYTLTDETRAEVRAEALEAAVDAARADADTVASAAGVSVTGVRTISTGGDYAPYPRFAAESADGGAATVLQPGPVEVTATVSITYEVQ
ncbi:hypothetical protein SAMN04487949_3146 [Halogranum gelatinilyticum]|uniref:SIMPL domain-containing protein n=1 Tax=Halogranum gelatinilyticum TaxID=660521 RepID=A0A1G9XWI1_9EURY|nr:SIMPL domain-containing protein [Halogranum gelatinilyticum]SDN00806.1 hypothetical protein SAMN04487949_3146 [Halogranum gelatinilyticum]